MSVYRRRNQTGTFINLLAANFKRFSFNVEDLGLCKKYVALALNEVGEEVYELAKYRFIQTSNSEEIPELSKIEEGSIILKKEEFELLKNLKL